MERDETARGNGLRRVAKEEGEKEEEAAARRLFEAWKRALDATIEVPDCEPAINASSLVEREPRSSGEGGYGGCRGCKRRRKDKSGGGGGGDSKRERERGREGGREREEENVERV